MSDLDLRAAIKAGGKALADMARDWYCPKHPDLPRYMCEWCLAEVAVKAAAPLIEAQVRAQDDPEGRTDLIYNMVLREQIDRLARRATR